MPLTPEPTPPTPAPPQPTPAAEATPKPSIDLDALEERMISTSEQEEVPRVTPPEAPEPTSPEGKPPVEAPSQPSPPPAQPTPDKLAEALEKLSERLGQPQTPTQPQEPVSTEPEFKFWEPTNEEADCLVEGGEKAKAVLNTMYRRAVEDSLKLSLTILNHVTRPLQDSYESQRNAQLEQRYLTKYPDHKEWTEEGRHFAMQIVQGGQKFKNEEDFFTAVAEKVNGLITKNRARFGTQAPARIPPPASTPTAGARKNGEGDGSLSEQAKLMKETFE
jgi:hypothetical protein